MISPHPYFMQDSFRGSWNDKNLTCLAISTQYKSLIYLVIIVVSVKERLFSEDHAGKHAAQTPHIK